jgi:hypothetical protein
MSNLSFKVARDGVTIFTTPWRSDVGRFVVQHWYEVDLLTVTEVRPGKSIEVKARTWYGGVWA